MFDIKMSWWLSKGLRLLREPNEVNRHDRGSLVNQLVKTVLTVGARFTPIDRSRFVGDVLPALGDVFAVGLHGELLEVRGKSV